MADALYVGFLLSGLVDSTGSVLQNGTVTFYESGTATLKDIWLDERKMDLAANPYTLDTVGVANIYADGLYTVVVKDETGTIIHTWDGLFFNPDPGNAFGDIIATDFGPMDGDTIQLAIISAAGEDRSVYLSAGNWEIGNNLTIPSNINLKYGMGAYTTTSTGVTLSFSGVVEAPLYNIFRGAGTTTLNSKINDYPTIWLNGGASTDRVMTGILTITGSQQVDNLNLNGNTLSSTSGALNILPFTGQAVVIDGNFSFDGTTLTGILDSNLVFTAFPGRNISIEGATFDGGIVTTTTVNANVTGNLTGEVLTASQPNITSVGTLSSLTISGGLTVDTSTFVINASTNDVTINGNFLQINSSSNSINENLILQSFNNTSGSVIQTFQNPNGTRKLQIRGEMTTGSERLEFLSGTGLVDFYYNGGVTVGSPTGGNKGIGTINISGDIYKNNTAYTNPDYVLEHFFTGKIDKFSKNEGASTYSGLINLNSLENYLKENFRLPGISDKAMGTFKRSDFILEKLEEIFLYLIQMEKRIKALESK